MRLRPVDAETTQRGGNAASVEGYRVNLNDIDTVMSLCVSFFARLLLPASSLGYLVEQGSVAHQFEFDGVLGEDCNQTKVHEEVRATPNPNRVSKPRNIAHSATWQLS